LGHLHAPAAAGDAIVEVEFMKGVWTAVLLTLLAAGGTVARPAEKWQDGARQVRVGEARGENDQIIVPLEIDDLSGVVAIDLNLIFDSAAFTIPEVRKTGLLAGFFAIHNVVGDTLKIAIAGAQEGKGSGAFIEIIVEGSEVPEFGLALVSLNGGLIPVAYEKTEEEEVPQGSTAVGEIGTLPDALRLEQNFPNPFNAETTLSFVLPERTHVRMAIFNMAGQRLRLLVDGEWSAGVHEVVWDGRGEDGRMAASGTFFYQLQAGTSARVRRMLLLR
jgi:hypothetical protein